MKSCVQELLVLLIVAVCLITSGCDTARNTEDPDLNYFVKYYGGDGNQYGVDMELLSDGTFLLLGNWAENAFDSDIYVMRVNAEGEVIWDTRHGGEDELWSAKDLELTSDGNFAVIADYRPSATDDSDIKLVKFSLDGTVIGEGLYGSLGNDNSRTVTPLTDGGFVISGTTDSTRSFSIAGETDPDPADAFDLRIDANFRRLSTSEWSPVFIGFGDNVDVTVKIFQRPGDNFYAFGHTNSTLAGETLNPNEKMGLFYYQRDERFGGQVGPGYPRSYDESNDKHINYVQLVGQEFGGGYMIIGTSQNSLEISEVFLARLRPTLIFGQNDVISYRPLPLNRNVRGVSGTTSVSGEVGFLVLGNEVRSTGATNVWISKIDQSGSVLWSATLGSEAEDDTGAAVRELPDGKIVILGTMGLADNQFKMALIKMNRRGQFLK